MATAYDPETTHTSEWQFWPGRENVTLRQQTAVGTYTSHTLSATGGAVKRRAITWKEMAASSGAYTNQDRAWLLPLANLPTGPILPKPGDQIRDSDSVDWTIGDITVGKFGLTFKCVCRALAIVSELDASGQLKRAAYAADTYGRPAGASYSNQGSAVLCRVQPLDSDANDTLGRVSMDRKFVAYLATPLDVRAHDQFVVGSTTYTITGFRNPERIWDLMELQLEDKD